MAEGTTTEIHLEVAINRQWIESKSTQVRSKAAILSKETCGTASVVCLCISCLSHKCNVTQTRELQILIFINWLQSWAAHCSFPRRSICH